MPITIGDYSYTAVDGDLTTPQRTGKPRYVYPFERDVSVYTVEEDYMVFIDYYVPLAPATVHSTIANLYFVSDTPIRDIGNGVGSYTRKWAVLPGYNEDGKKTAYVYSEWESYAFTVPGIASTQGLFLVTAVASSTVSNGYHYITCQSSHDISAGDLAKVRYYVVDPINGFTYYRYQTKQALAGTGGALLVVKELKDINTVFPLAVQRSDGEQAVYTKVVASRIDKDYWLEGVNVDSIEDIPIIEEFSIISSETGNRTEFLTGSAPLTSPSLSEYVQWIEDGVWIAAESSVVRPWQGKIFERSTRFVRATL